MFPCSPDVMVQKACTVQSNLQWQCIVCILHYAPCTAPFARRWKAEVSWMAW